MPKTLSRICVAISAVDRTIIQSSLYLDVSCQRYVSRYPILFSHYLMELGTPKVVTDNLLCSRLIPDLKSPNIDQFLSGMLHTFHRQQSRDHGCPRYFLWWTVVQRLAKHSNPSTLATKRRLHGFNDCESTQKMHETSCPPSRNSDYLFAWGLHGFNG